MDDRTAHAKIQELVDRQEIHDVLMRYCRGCDRADAEMMASAFHPDGIMEQDVPRLGLDLARLATSMEIPHLMHFTGNVLIELDGDTAHVESYFLSFSSPEVDGTPSTRTRAARYLDRFERRDGVWKIAYRLVVDEWARVDPVAQTPDHVGGNRGVRGPEDAVFHMDERLRPVAADA